MRKSVFGVSQTGLAAIEDGWRLETSDLGVLISWLVPHSWSATLFLHMQIIIIHFIPSYTSDKSSSNSTRTVLRFSRKHSKLLSVIHQHSSSHIFFGLPGLFCATFSLYTSAIQPVPATCPARQPPHQKQVFL